MKTINTTIQNYDISCGSWHQHTHVAQHTVVATAVASLFQRLLETSHTPHTLPMVSSVLDLAFHLRQSSLKQTHTNFKSFQILPFDIRKIWLCFICESQGNLNHDWKSPRSTNDVLRSRQKDMMSFKVKVHEQINVNPSSPEKGPVSLFLLSVDVICPPRRLILSSLSLNQSSWKKLYEGLNFQVFSLQL